MALSLALLQNRDSWTGWHYCRWRERWMRRFMDRPRCMPSTMLCDGGLNYALRIVSQEFASILSDDRSRGQFPPLNIDYAKFSQGQLEYLGRCLVRGEPTGSRSCPVLLTWVGSSLSRSLFLLGSNMFPDSPNPTRV